MHTDTSSIVKLMWPFLDCTCKYFSMCAGYQVSSQLFYSVPRSMYQPAYLAKKPWPFTLRRCRLRLSTEEFLLPSKLQFPRFSGRSHDQWTCWRALWRCTSSVDSNLCFCFNSRASHVSANCGAVCRLFFFFRKVCHGESQAAVRPALLGEGSPTIFLVPSKWF